MSSLAADNKHLQRKVDIADANSGEMKVRVCVVLIVAYGGDYHKICVHLHRTNATQITVNYGRWLSVMFKAKMQ